jgi:DNA helicase-2/ATP-dependent DNA helicase PcrA
VKEPKYIGSDQEMKRMSRRKAHRAIEPLRDKAQKLEFVDVLGLYRDLFENRELYADLARESQQKLPAEWDALKLYTSSKLAQGEILYEDATPLVYLKGLIEGQQTVNTIRYVIVDEAQDYTPFQYAYLRKLFPRARFTLLGDWNQGIFTHASQRGGYSSINELMPEEETETIRLNKSYRSTREIIEFAGRILPKGEPVEPFNRSGEPPQVEQAADESQLVVSIEATVREWTAKGMQSIAIICKTERETRRAYERLIGRLPQLQLITKETLHFAAGIMILPAYLAKGLEFDAVLIYNASQSVYGDEKERKLFYTACTRALHLLKLFYTGERSEFLDFTYTKI